MREIPEGEGAALKGLRVEKNLQRRDGGDGGCCCCCYRGDATENDDEIAEGE
jgi:hypothetical protein